MLLMIYFMFSICLLCAYLGVILIYIYYWNQVKDWDLPDVVNPRTSIAVLVAARNEAASIERCLEALVQQDYPMDRYNLYIIDDHSEDDTAAIVQDYADRYPQLHLLTLPDDKTGKKRALEHGINHSEGMLIVTTDADCTMSTHWLSCMAHFYEENNLKFVAGPVAFYEEQSLFERFQSLDFMGMIAVAAAGIKGRFMGMCNGANLAYERTVFEAVHGFEGIDHLASGDDMLLLQKIQAHYPNQIGFLKQKEATTYTHAKPTLKAFVEQRIRWSSKSGAYQGWQVNAMLGTVWLLCLSMMVDLIGSSFNGWFVLLLGIKLGIKGLCDYFFLRMMATFFDRLELMNSHVPASIMHWWYITVVGTTGLFRKRYEWKGRRVQ